MLDRNYLKVPYHKDAILGGGWFVLNKQQQIQLTSKIDQAIKKAELIDKTHMSEKLKSDNPKLRKRYEGCAELYDFYHGDLTNVLRRIHPEDFVKMDVDRNRWNNQLRENGCVVYVYGITEYIHKQKHEVYIKFNFNKDETKIYLTSCHYAEHPIMKVPPTK